ncbi:MAG: DUF2461 domain-containing protein [Sphingobacteriaceae bacterium]
MIHPKTFTFLSQLATNNNRDWFHAHKQQHDEARENVLAFVAQIKEELCKIDPGLPTDLDPKDCVMRIYRDIRFSKDKTPYKTNFGVGISPDGKNFNGPGYYLHIHPKQSFLAGGCWMPEANILKAIRQEIDYNGADFHTVIDRHSFKNYFGYLDAEDKLKTTPKGYSVDHPDISYLQLKSFTVSHPLSPDDLQGADATKKVVKGFSELYPFIAFLRRAIG